MQNFTELYEKLFAAENLLVLTGAGMSTACGIPDFRSPQGIWNGPDGARNQYLFSRDGFNRCQPEFFNAFRKMYGQFASITSSGPYGFLQALGESGLKAVIATQNIDGLHKRFGNDNFQVYELHGTATTFPCLKCGKRYPAEKLLAEFDGVNPPRTSCCNGRYDTDITLFGDMLPRCFDELMAEIKRFDYLLVMGSSLEVSPVNMIPRYFPRERKAIINLQPTIADESFGCVINDDIGVVLKRLAEFSQFGSV